MPTFLNIPKVRIAASLFLIYITAALRFPNFNSLSLLISCLGLTIFFDLLFAYFRKHNFFIPWAAVVTGLILTLIVDPTMSWYQIAIVSALAMGIKNFLRISQRHIFNPLASGLFLGGLIFNQYASWWAVSFQNIIQSNIQNLPFFLILLSPALTSVFRFKKHYSMLTFIMTNLLLTHLSHPFLTFESVTSKIFDPSTVFFILVMLPEPMTSPVNYKKQLLYGALVATIPFIFSHPLITNFLTNTNLSFDTLLFGLLLGNLLFFKYR